MKGVVFIEFLDMVDERFGPNTTEAIVSGANLRNAGAFTSVGSYEAVDLSALIGKLCEHSGLGANELVRDFGRHLLTRFADAHPAYFLETHDLFEFVTSIERRVHGDVLKLYPDAELPTLKVERPDPTQTTVLYRSRRRLADLAEGLLLGAIAHFNAAVTLQRTDLPDHGDEQCTLFTLWRNAPRSH